jgi:tRNA(adenine34) deaminase
MTLYRPSERFMREAIVLASLNIGGADHAVGAVVTCLADDGEEIIGMGRNSVHRLEDPCAHAEMQALYEALNSDMSRRSTGGTARDRRVLRQCVMYSTHEPCVMCAGAIWASRMLAVVYGTSVEDVLALGREYSSYEWRVSGVRLVQAVVGSADRHPVQIVGSYLREECRRLLLDGVRDIFELLDHARRSDV